MEELNQKIKDMINKDDVVLFMKGTLIFLSVAFLLMLWEY